MGIFVQITNLDNSAKLCRSVLITCKDLKTSSICASGKNQAFVSSLIQLLIIICTNSQVPAELLPPVNVSFLLFKIQVRLQIGIWLIIFWKQEKVYEVRPISLLVHKASSVIPDLEQDKHACIYILNYQKVPKYCSEYPPQSTGNLQQPWIFSTNYLFLTCVLYILQFYNQCGACDNVVQHLSGPTPTLIC